MRRFRSFVESLNQTMDRSGQLGWQPGDLSFSGVEQQEIGEERAPSFIKQFDMSHMKNNAPDAVLSDDEMNSHADHRRTFTPKHHEELENYKFGSNHAFNDHLRLNYNPSRDKVVRHSEPWYTTQHHEEFMHNIAAMDHITSHPTTEPMSTYRGFAENFRVDHLHPGQELTDHGYTGNSLHKEVAAGFAGSNHELHPLEFKTIAKINIPPGTKAHYLDHPDHVPDSLETFRHEHEMTLQRGTRFRVKGHSLHHDKATGIKYHITHLDVVGQHPTAITNSMSD